MTRSTMPDDELAARLQASALHLMRRLALEDRAGGSSPPRASALTALVFGGPRTIGSLARHEGVTAPTMTRLVASMVADGLVERLPDEMDRRVVRVTATPAGRSLLLAGKDRRVTALTTMLGPLTAKERRRLANAVEIVDRMLGQAG